MGKEEEQKPEIEQSAVSREEFMRRFAISQLRKAQYSRVQDWWWATDESLSLIGSQLSECNHCVIDNFLGDDGFRNVRHDVMHAKSQGLISEDGRLNGGREGNATMAAIDKYYRSDTLGWFNCSALPSSGSLSCQFVDSDTQVDSEAPWEGLQYLLQRLETVVAEVRPKVPDLKDTSSRSKTMVTVYPADSLGYKRHIDNANRNGRRLTLIYYIGIGNMASESYKRSFGGQLRIHHEKSSTFVDVEPIGDRLVLFYSDSRCPHEVMPVHCHDRYAITLWFFDSIEKREAASAESQSQKEKTT